MNGLVASVAGWLLTYLVHSTLLLGAVWLLTRYVVRRESLRETLWKTALVGGLATATVAMALPRPGALAVELEALSPASAQDASADGAVREPVAGTPAGSAESAGARSGLPVDGEEGGPEQGAAGPRSPAAQPTTEGAGKAGRALVPGPGPGGAASSPTPASQPAGPGAADGSAASASVVMAWAVGIWLAIALLLLGRLVYRHVRLRILLRDREPVSGSTSATSVLAELRRSAGVWMPVRLTCTPAVATPLALGRAEICLPARFLEELGPAEQRAALAHELAHLKRLDPLWQVAGAVIGAVFFFQPLNRVARREIRSAAEYLADGWAVRHTGARVELARCLASVAGWAAPSAEPALAGTMAMAEGGSPLMARVQRLLEHEPEQATSPVLRLAVAGLVLAVAAGFGPVVGGATPGPVSGAELDAPAEAAATRNARAEPGGDRDTDTGTDADQSATTGTEGVKPEQAGLDVRRFDGPALEGDGFVARLNAAGRDAAGAPYWVAYGIDGAGSEELVIDSDRWSSRELGGAALAGRLGVSDELWTALEEPVLVMVRLVPDGAATRVDRITVRRPSLGARIDGTVYWLGYPTLGESFRWFRDMNAAMRDGEIRETAVAVMGIHPLPEAGAALRQILESREEDGLRAEAAEGLRNQRPDTATARLLLTVALGDRDGRVRQQAAESLARVEPGLAVELLARLARESDDEGVQRQAVESLGAVGTPAARTALDELLTGGRSRAVQDEALDQLAELPGGIDGERLLDLAVSGDDPDLRREAVERMADLPSDAAVALLRRVAFESGDETAERQAAESLGDVGTRAAFDVLVEILERNPGEDASFQAVESIADGFPRDMAVPVLRDVLRNHPSSRVRREAVDQLSDLGG